MACLDTLREGLAMMSERDIEVQLGETDERIRAVVAEIGPLQEQVSQGMDGWQNALAALAECYNRRRELQVRRDSLSWVLS
jgi:hypothetical protein